MADGARIRSYRDELTCIELTIDVRAGVHRWLEHPNITLVGPTEQYWSVLRELLIEAQISGPLVTDAALAALAVEQGATLCSTDRDFRRFRGLKVIDPLQLRTS